MTWNNEKTAAGRTFAVILIPLVLADRVIGVFGVINFTSRKPFLMADRRLMFFLQQCFL